ncbi:MFS transporter [Acidiplasma cupricumulans]|uniref:MFS transporter n=1 Tax=Acidiplasma cupricumulans TaxID=312540 RepID=UPI000780C38C|nr:MFS transporter [Acidiplasma cupricumulans]
MKAPRIAYFVGLSAMFADMGYQGAMALLPVYLVFVLKLNFIYFGIAEALIFGFGSLFSYLGGKLSDRYGSKNVAVAGNSLIPFLSFTGFTYIPLISVGLFSTGWWMRNLRSPARRAFLAENTEENERTSSFGILHSLDVGGGIISILILVILILLNFTYKYLFLFSIFPIIISTLILASIKSNKHLPLKKQ